MVHKQKVRYQVVFSHRDNFGGQSVAYPKVTTKENAIKSVQRKFKDVKITSVKKM